MDSVTRSRRTTRTTTWAKNLILAAVYPATDGPNTQDHRIRRLAMHRRPQRNRPGDAPATAAARRQPPASPPAVRGREALGSDPRNALTSFPVACRKGTGRVPRGRALILALSVMCLFTSSCGLSSASHGRLPGRPAAPRPGTERSHRLQEHPAQRGQVVVDPRGHFGVDLRLTRPSRSSARSVCVSIFFDTSGRCRCNSPYASSLAPGCTR